MLPPGHIAAGFLTAYGFVKIIKPDLDPSQINQLLALGAFAGFVPDLDEFWVFFKEKSFTVRDIAKNDHRNLVSHAPLFWLLAGMVIFVLSKGAFVREIGIIVWLCSWSHLALDTIEHGIMWLWPFSKKQFFLFKVELENIKDPGFWNYWARYIKIYAKRKSFYLEILIIFITLIVLV